MATESRSTSLSNQFFDKAQDVGLLLEVIDDVFGFGLSIKDRLGRFVFLNSEMQFLLGANCPESAIGTTDSDHFPEAIADQVMKADAEVMNNGTPLRGIREPFVCPGQGFSWSITSRWPIRDNRGEIIGVLGTYRVGVRSILPDPENQPSPPLRKEKFHEEIQRTTEFITDNAHRTLTSEEIARNVGVSARHLNRILHDTHMLSLRNFATTIRIQLASKALIESNAPIIEIAHNHGFANQSSFTTQFKKFTGSTPRQFRFGVRN